MSSNTVYRLAGIAWVTKIYPRVAFECGKDEAVEPLARYDRTGGKGRATCRAYRQRQSDTVRNKRHRQNDPQNAPSEFFQHSTSHRILPLTIRSYTHSNHRLALGVYKARHAALCTIHHGQIGLLVSSPPPPAHVDIEPGDATDIIRNTITRPLGNVTSDQL